MMAAAQEPASRQAHPSGFFVLRTPLLPLATVTDWGRGLEAPACAADPAALEAAIAGDRLRLRSRLDELCSEPGFREAIFVASPSLEAAIDSWRKDPDGDRGQRAESSLVAYLMRAAARPTPFGLFAGCTTGSIGETTRLQLPGRAGFRRHTRLDMDYLWALARAIEADPVLRADLRYWPNSCLHGIGDRLQFAHARDRGAGSGRSYHLVAVDNTPYLAQTLARARDGERLDVLARALATGDIGEAEATAYLAELVDSQLLVADCQPPVTGPPPAQAMAATLASYPATAGVAAKLRGVLTSLAAMDDGGVGCSPDAYRAIAGDLASLPAAPDPSRLVQVDLIKPAAEATLSAPVVADILRGAQTLHALARHGGDGALAKFREQFSRRYETREMPLAQVLDEETGIGFMSSGQVGADGVPLLAGLPLQPHPDRPQSWTRRDAFLYRKLTAAIAAGHSEVSIDTAEADAVRGRDDPPLPGAFDVLAVIVAGSQDAVRRGEYRVVIGSAGGPSGVRLLGRFCHADDDLRGRVRAHLRAEEHARPDCVFAEIVHLPQGRTGNILSRPVMRAYEIPYLGRSGAPASRQLPVSDLLVSVQGERIVLRSATLGREVIPRLTAAHDYSRAGLGTYRFLCALQHQEVSPGVMWDWGPLRDTPFLPRVVSGRAVLSRATWNLGKPELAAFCMPRGARQFSAVQQLRARLGLPRYVALADTDNELVTDLDNVLCVEALARQVRRRASVCLVELLPGPDQLCVSGPEGRFTHQVIVPFVRPAPRPAGPDQADQSRRPQRPQRAASVARRFTPGSEWLYLKLFNGPAIADQVLLDLAPVLSGSLASGSIDSWHFVRYGDPDWHIRLRLHGSPEALLRGVLPRLRDRTQPLLRAGLLWRVQLDTYEREVERYCGPGGIAHAERIFHADSEAVIEIMRQLPGDAGAELRFRLALRGIDQLFGDLGLSLAQKREIARAARQGYGTEFGTGGAFQHAVSARFRRERSSLELVLGAGQEAPREVAGCIRALDGRSAAIAVAGRQIRALAGTGPGLGPGLAELAMSLAHMHVNRLLRSAQRAQELVLYEMLDRLYASRAAREAR
jgi:thiopeptide-type bacteriocin biosynthesis protein